MLIVGAKGFAKELLTTFRINDYSDEIVLYDGLNVDNLAMLFGKYKILRNDEEVISYFNNVDTQFTLGVGNPHLRYKLNNKFISLGGTPYNLISKNAIIGDLENTIESGTCILNNVIIEANNFISEGCLIHVGVFISHDTRIGKFCELSPYTKILGEVQIGDFCALGTGCVILPKVKLGNKVVVGANAVVTKDVPDNTTVIGIPAKPLVK